MIYYVLLFRVCLFLMCVSVFLCHSSRFIRQSKRMTSIVKYFLILMDLLTIKLMEVAFLSGGEQLILLMEIKIQLYSYFWSQP